jgi:hypothetical protein
VNLGAVSELPSSKHELNVNAAANAAKNVEIFNAFIFSEIKIFYVDGAKIHKRIEL